MNPILYTLFAFALPALVLSSSLDQVVIPPMAANSEAAVHLGPNLFDLLTIEPSASIFFSYARETHTSRLLMSQSSNITVLVPTNHAVMALARKPHQDSVPVDDGVEITEQELDARSKKNVERWISVHIIPQSPISLAAHKFATLADGKDVTFEEIQGDPSAPEWTRFLLNGDIRLLQKKEASNGVIYLIDGTVKDD